MTETHLKSRKQLFGSFFPVMSTQTLAGTTPTIPRTDPPTKVTLLCLAGPQCTQTQLNEWSVFLRERYTTEDVAHIEAFFLSYPDRMAQTCAAMAEAIDSRFHHLVHIIAGSFDSYRQALMLESSSEMTIFVLDHEGRILFSHHGPATEYARYRVSKTVTSIRSSDEASYRVVSTRKNTKKKACILDGGTPLARELVQQLLLQPGYQHIYMVSDKPSGIVHPKCTDSIIDYKHPHFSQAALGCDEVYLCFQRDKHYYNTCAVFFDSLNHKALPSLSMCTSFQYPQPQMVPSVSYTRVSFSIFLGQRALSSTSGYFYKLFMVLLHPFLIGKWSRLRVKTVQQAAKIWVAAQLKDV